MAIAYDNSIGSTGLNTNTNTISYTVGSGSNRLLVVAVFYAAGGSVSGVTYNGSALTFINTASGSGATNVSSLFYLLNPSTGANNLVVTMSSSIVFSYTAASYSGVKQTGQPDANNSGGASSSSLTVGTTTVADNCWLIGGGRVNGTPSAGTNSTLRITGGYNAYMLDTNAPQTPAGSHSLQIVSTGSNDLTLAMASFAPAPAPASTANAALLLTQLI